LEAFLADAGPEADYRNLWQAPAFPHGSFAHARLAANRKPPMADPIKAQQAQGNHFQAPHPNPASSSSATSVSQDNSAQRTLKTDIPARLDRLPWSRFHLLVVLALGITWVLDGLEVTIVGAIGPVLQNSQTLGLSAAEIGGAASAYVSGAVIGALVFGWLTDRRGRRLVFYVTLAVYLVGVLATATSWDALSFAAFRAITGFGIGGEYAAINSAIDELIPARYRGRIDLIVNGSFWLGAAAGSGAAVVLLDPNLMGPDTGWRLSFAIGGVLGFGILLMRRHVPESPRWLVTHGHLHTAETSVGDIEARVHAETGRELDRPKKVLEVHPRTSFGLGLIFRAMLGKYRNRSILALTLMVAQSFLCHAG
jgi:MFS family permease